MLAEPAVVLGQEVGRQVIELGGIRDWIASKKNGMLWYSWGMTSDKARRSFLFWNVLVLLLAAALRLPHSNWDAAIAAHPDERFLLGAASSTPLWGDVCSASPDFPYGHLPVYLARLLVLSAPGSDPLYAARLLSGLLGVLLVALAGAYGRALGGPRAGLIAATLLALAPAPIQQARFYTVDPLGAVLASAAILAAMRRHWRAAGVLAGLALACKLSLIWCAATVITGYLSRFTFHVSRFIHPSKIQNLKSKILLPFLLAFVLASPWALLRPVACWRGPLTQTAMAAGRLIFPYTLQYRETWPFVYPLAQMTWWGLGPVATAIGVWALGRVVWRWRSAPHAARIALIWTALYFLATAGLYVKFPRYLLPIYPIWVAWTAMVCLGDTAPAQKSKAPAISAQHAQPKRRMLFAGLPVCRFVLLALTLATTAALGLAQIGLYAQPHPWETASRWIYRNIPDGATLAIEMWDQPLPVWLPGGDPARYTQITLPMFDEDSAEKQSHLEAALQTADVIVLASHRGYGTLSRQGMSYAETSAWYKKVLEEREIVVFGRCPRLGILALSDDPLAEAGLPAPATLAERCNAPAVLRLPRLDESWRVYDAPIVLLAIKTSE